MAYYLALVDKTDTTFSDAFARQDENMRSFSVTHDEGDFCSLSVVIEKPSAALLDPSRDQWVWLSMGNGTGNTPLFFGRIVGLPANIQNEFVTVEFIAKPVDFGARKNVVAATLRVHPFWDYAFIDPQMWDDADATLEARTQVWHIDRVTHTVTASSIVAGEETALNITSDLIPADGFDLSYREAPLRKVNLEIRAMWTQQKKGSINLKPALLKAFENAGSPAGFVTSYTGAGLYNTWPMEDNEIGQVYKFGPQKIDVADGLAIKRKFKKVKVKFESAPSKGADQAVPKPGNVYFRRWAFTIESSMKYDVAIDRTEDISFDVYADVQSMINDIDDEQSEIITISSGNIGIEVGPPGDKELPIGNVSRDAYFPTPRGRKSIEYGLCHARALLMRRARAAEVTVRVPFTTAILASCRKSANVYHPDLPGGVANGKIISYQFGVDGDSGEETGLIKIACMVGRASSFSSISGTPVYAEADYVGSDYQVFVGARFVEGTTGMLYDPPHSDTIQPAIVGVQSVTVNNGETFQRDEMKKRYLDVAAACDFLNSIYTEVDLRMIPIDTSPRELKYDDSDVDLPIPKGIDLGEA